MSCSSEQNHILFDYARGRLSADGRKKVEDHLSRCEGCRKELEYVGQLAGALSQLDEATRHDLPQDAAERLMSRAAVALRGTAGVRVVRRRFVRTLGRRLLVPVAAAVAVLVGIHIADRLLRPPVPQVSAMEQLYADAKYVGTLDGINELEPVARRAMDETMATPMADLVGRVGYLQLVHYITVRAVDPRQIEDVHFLLALLQEDDRKRRAMAARDGPDVWDVLAGLESRASAAEPEDLAGRVRGLMAEEKYDEAYRVLAADKSPETKPLAAYAAIRAGRMREADELLEALLRLGRGDPRLIELLRTEVALISQQYGRAMNHLATAAESDNRLWLQAGYLCKYELSNEVLAGQFFERTADDRVAAHIARRFGGDLRLARLAGDMKAEDFEGYPVNSLPESWKLDAMRSGESQIVRLDGSNVLRQNEMGRRGGTVTTGYPGWSNYTLSCDFKVLKAESDPQVDLVVYELGLSHYALRLRDRTAQLVHKTYRRGESLEAEPAGARAELSRDVCGGDWWRAAIEVRNVDDRQTRVGVAIWPREHEAEVRRFAWTESAGEGQQPLRRGHVSFHIGGAEVAIDNIYVTANDARP